MARARRSAAAGGLLAAALLALGLSPTAFGAGEGAAGSGRQAAAGDAEARLASLDLPPGTESVSAKPPGADPELNGPPLEPATPNLVDRGAWWVVPGVPAEVLAWFRAHPPAGAALNGGGSGANARTGTEFQYLQIAWPPLPNVDQRLVLVSVTSLADANTALRVDSQAVWVIPHPASERIPAAARLLEVEWQGPRGHVLIRRTSNPRFIRSLVALLDSLPVVQPGVVYACPAMPANPPTVTLRFRARRGGPLLAEATQALPPGICSGMSLRIAGRPQPVLEGAGAVIRRLRELR